jgi:hypothetical protein
MINFCEVLDGEMWELFVRDLLVELGFIIESGPDRGADGGKDIIAREIVKGNLGSHEFRWLVSCKHFAHSNKSVTEKDEPNILERVHSFKAYGFIGAYSTIPSSGLNSRLKSLKETGDLSNYRILDSKVIESHCISTGFSNLLMRYFPESYKSIKPLHVIFDKYYPLKCKSCGKDLLTEMYKKHYSGNIIMEAKYDTDGNYLIRDIYCVCKSLECDRKDVVDDDEGYHTLWEDLADACLPTWYLRWICTTLNNLRSGKYKYTDHAFDKEKELILTLGQKVLRDMTKEERERTAKLTWIKESLYGV